MIDLINFSCSDRPAPGAAGGEHQQLVGVHRQAQPRGARDTQQSQETCGGCHHPSHDHWQGHLKLRTQAEEGIPKVPSSRRHGEY